MTLRERILAGDQTTSHLTILTIGSAPLTGIVPADTTLTLPLA